MTKNVVSMEDKKKAKMPEVTVCVQCKFFINLEPGSSREHVWYNHLCSATPLPKKIDPYDGKKKPWSRNDLGGEYFSDNEFKYCKNVNDGKCPKFESR